MDDSRKPRRPDYLLVARAPAKPGEDPNAKRLSGTIGAAWIGEGATGRFVSIRLSPGVVLDWSQGLEITLFSNGGSEERRGAKGSHPSPNEFSRDGDGCDGEVPFG